MYEKCENTGNCFQNRAESTNDNLVQLQFTLAKLQSQLVFLLYIYRLIVLSQNHIAPRRPTTDDRRKRQKRQKHSAFRCCCHRFCRRYRRRCRRRSADKINYKTVSDQKIHLANCLESISLNWRIHFGHVAFRSPSPSPSRSLSLPTSNFISFYCHQQFISCQHSFR